MLFWTNLAKVWKPLNFWILLSLLALQPVFPLSNRLLYKGRVESKDFHKISKSVFFKLIPIWIPIIQRKGLVGYFHIDVIIEAQNSQSHKALEPKLPHLYSRLFETCYGVAPFLIDTGYIPPLSNIRKYLFNALKKEPYGLHIRNVLAQNAFLKPLPPSLL
jgi:hypothetical protein